MSFVYFDHNATSPLEPEVCAAMRPYLSDGAPLYGNPSSLHGPGRRARQAVEAARDAVAALVGADREEVVFTSGGTEGNNLGVIGAAEAVRTLDPSRTGIVASPLEHPSVLGSLERLKTTGFPISWLKVDAQGCIDLQAASSLMMGDRAGLLVVQLANHELGNLYPVAELAAIAHSAKMRVHCDCVQAAGKIPLDLHALGVDTATISAHKIGGPKGVGALYLRRGGEVSPRQLGGHQERERRAGTENVLGIVGLGAAAEVARSRRLGDADRLTRLRDRLERGLIGLGAERNGSEERVCNTINVRFSDVDGELLVASLDLAGFCASTGAACSSGSIEPSPVLLALGQAPAVAKRAVRFSLGPSNREDEIDGLLAQLPAMLERIRAARPHPG